LLLWLWHSRRRSRIFSSSGEILFVNYIFTVHCWTFTFNRGNWRWTRRTYWQFTIVYKSFFWCTTNTRFIAIRNNRTGARSDVCIQWQEEEEVVAVEEEAGNFTDDTWGYVDRRAFSRPTITSDDWLERPLCEFELILLRSVLPLALRLHPGAGIRDWSAFLLGNLDVRAILRGSYWFGGDWNVCSSGTRGTITLEYWDVVRFGVDQAADDDEHCR